jgi:hypothetical protein
MQSAGVHRARVSHLVGAPCGTTALAGLHRLMPVLVPAVVPLMPSNKANESSLHGAAFPTEPTLRRQHPVYTTKRAHEQDGLLVVATPAYQTAYQSVRPEAIKLVLRRTLVTLSAAAKRGRILADTEGVNLTYASAASDRIKAGGLPPCPPLLASSLWTASPACALPGSL